MCVCAILLCLPKLGVCCIYIFHIIQRKGENKLYLKPITSLICLERSKRNLRTFYVVFNEKFDTFIVIYFHCIVKTVLKYWSEKFIRV